MLQNSQTVDQMASRVGMISASRIAKLVFVGLTVAWLSTPVLARGISPGNGGPINLTPLPWLPGQDAQASSNNSSSDANALAQKFGFPNGTLDFFSVRPDNSGSFNPLLRGGIGDGGLQLQLKW
jgi:hypothetical protein